MRLLCPSASCPSPARPCPARLASCAGQGSASTAAIARCTTTPLAPRGRHPEIPSSTSQNRSLAGGKFHYSSAFVHRLCTGLHAQRTELSTGRNGYRGQSMSIRSSTPLIPRAGLSTPGRNGFVPTLSTLIHRSSQALSPAVDNGRLLSPQMWTKPGEIDVDRHGESLGFPPPVETCGFPVEETGDDGPEAPLGCPHAGGQTPWISGGQPVDNGGQPSSGSPAVDPEGGLYPGYPHVNHRWITL